jgi:hypothetical protein
MSTALKILLAATLLAIASGAHAASSRIFRCWSNPCVTASTWSRWKYAKN